MFILTLMKLEEYMKKSGLKIGDFAREIDVTNMAVHNWISEKRTPNQVMMQKIVSITKGEVTPNDFYGVE